MSGHKIWKLNFNEKNKKKTKTPYSNNGSNKETSNLLPTDVVGCVQKPTLLQMLLVRPWK